VWAKIFTRSPLNRKGWVWWHVSSIPAVVGDTNRKILVQAGLGIKQDIISKITKGKVVWRHAQVIECLPSKRETWSSITGSVKKEKEKEEEK
jgi:hypothetical protein